MQTLQSVLENVSRGKKGIEIGGPSQSTGQLIYHNASSMDNVIFSEETVWSNNTSTYNYYQEKQGNVIICDAVNLSSVKNDTYEFCFASHSLEHIANPIKAVKEWIRVIKPGGHVVLILPEKSVCFDHNRNISSFTTLVDQYNKNVGEDDLSTLSEILENHDLTMDLAAGDFESFKQRSLQNFNNRCLHHYVYNADLLKQICEYCSCKFIYTITDGLNIWFIMRKGSISKLIL
jgi:SAM-dependent methyltransferase